MAEKDSEKVELEEEWDEREEAYLIRHKGDLVGQLTWAPTPISDEDEVGENWVFTPPPSMGEEEEWTDLDRSDRKKALARAKKLITDHLSSSS